jgi:hypothetical protein
MKRASIVLVIFSSLIVLLMCTLALTKPHTLEEAFQLQAATLLFHICGAILFLFAIKGFSQELKTAYRFMSAGAAMLLLGVIDIYALTAAGVSNRQWSAVVIEVPFIFMAVFFYTGIRKFAQLILVHGWLIRGGTVFPLAGFLAIGFGFVPGIVGPEPFFDVLSCIRFFNVQLFLAGAILAFNVRTITSPVYRPAFRWFAGFFGITVINTILGFMQELAWIQWFGQVSIVLYLLAGIALSVTAFQFNRLAYAEKNEHFRQKPKDRETTQTSIDINVFLAGFVSNSASVDPILDPMREITATLTPSQRPDERQQAVLAQVYLGLEEYLVTKEPLRKFEQKDLRQMIAIQFKDTVNEPVFWSKVPVATFHS